MKEFFDECVVEVIRFEAEDVITVSDPDDCNPKACTNKTWEG